LPFFIESHSAQIVGLFLGIPDLYDYAKATTPNRTFRFIEEHYLDNLDYFILNFAAKYTLSLFLSVIDNLLDLGVNLEELTFFHLQNCPHFKNAKQAGLWNEDIIRIDKGFRRRDGMYFESDKLISLLNFANLSEFLDKVVELIDFEYQYKFIADDTTIDYSKILPVGNSDVLDMSIFPEEYLVSVKALCQSMKKKLRKMALDTEFNVLKRKIAELKAKLEKNSAHLEDNSLLLVKIKELYEEIAKFPESLSNNLKSFLDSTLCENGINISNESKSVLPEGDKKFTYEKLLKKLQELDARTKKIESKVDSLEGKIVDYLENGGDNPLKNKYIPREELIRILLNYEVKTDQEKKRRNYLLKALGISALSFMMLSLSLKSDNHQNSLKKAMPSISIETIEDASKINIGKINNGKAFNNSDDDSQKKDILKSNEEIAIEIIRGTWGNGEERRELLENASYDYETIQALVNDILLGRKSLEEIYSKVENQSIKRG